MSFDLFYQPCHLETEPVVRKNPFTGEMQTILPVKPLSAEHVRGVREVLAAAEARGPDEFGCVVVEFSDGGEAEVFADQVETGCMVTVRGLTPDLLRFLFDLLVAADWMLLPAMEGNPAIVSSPRIASGVADDFLEVACSSPEELGAVLSGGHGRE